MIEENFFEDEEITYLGNRSFSQVSLFITDKERGKWVSSLITGSLALVQLKDVGAPIVLLRIWQENEAGDLGKIVFEAEIPLNFNMEKLDGKFTSISCLKNGNHFGFYFNKGVSDCSIFNMHLTELQG